MRLRRLIVLVLLALALPSYARAAPAAGVAAPERCFPEVGACIRAPFLDYWLSNGGVPIYGLPLADAGLEVLEDGQLHLVQYFERARLELHYSSPERGPAHSLILLGQFGRALHPADPPVPARPGATYFDVTGHNVTPDFFAFWEANGGLAQFGHPLSEEVSERLEDGNAYTVQYFERARFERHPEHAPPYTIELGQFGRYFYGRSLLSPRGAVPACRPDDLAVSATNGAAGGSTYVRVTLRQRGVAPCRLNGFVRPALFADDGGALPVTEGYGVAFGGPPAQSPLTVRPGQTAEATLIWANNCPSEQPIDPAPATRLGIALPDGEGDWSFPIGGPRCGAHGAPKGIGVAALSLTLGDVGGTAYRVLDQYFADIARGNYRRAFGLFSPELQAELGPYDRFAAGFAGTRFVALAITGWVPLDDQTVRLDVRLAARQTDGTVRSYLGSYDVRRLPAPVTTYPDGRIVGADIVEDRP